MSDEKEFELAEVPPTRPFLGANARDGTGKSMFPEVGSKLTLRVVAVEAFTKNKAVQPALVLTDTKGTEYIRPLGKSNQYELRAFGFKSANEAVNYFLTFTSYDTGSSGAYQFGLSITGHSKDRPKV